MLAAFCLRLALGMVAFLPLLPVDKMHPRFFRTQFLTALGFNMVALWAIWDERIELKILVSMSAVTCFVASVFWCFQPAIFGKTTLTLSIALGMASAYAIAPGYRHHCFLDSASSALLLGAAITGMLVGHSYLISPGLTTKPLLTMIAVLAASLVFRVVVIGYFWLQMAPAESVRAMTTENTLMLISRYLIGFGGPLVFGIMAYLAARIRSTQSATGILFVVVICTFLGELLSLVLTPSAASPL